MRGLNQEQFAEYLKDSFVSVWVDDTSSVGTFPIESMASRTPVIGKVPNLKPDWMSENNGVWTYELNQMTDIIAEFTQNWLEDNINEDLYNLHERFSNLEDAQEISYMVPYEKDAKKGNKKLTKKMYEDDKDIIYQEEGDHKIYHSKK